MDISKLTDNEKKTLEFLYTYRCQKEIADELGCEVRRVKQYCTNIYKKLDMEDRYELMGTRIIELQSAKKC